MFLTGGFVSLALALFLRLLLNRLFRPLLQVTALSRRIADGDYAVRLPEDGKDEVAQMARSFNHMAGEVKDKVTELAAAAENRQRFVDNFSHELRTPLTNIHGYAEYLKQASLSEEDTWYALECILSESNRMQVMASQLMELSGLRIGEIRMEPVSLPHLLESVKASLAQKFLDKGLRLHIDCQVKTLTGDKALIHILLSNLMDNAAKASNPDTVVSLESFYQDGRTVVAVTDQGLGMEESELTRITDPFYRVDKARSRHDGGVGLGLAICRQIAQRHGAELSFHSAPGRGTTATIRFTTL